MLLFYKSFNVIVRQIQKYIYTVNIQHEKMSTRYDKLLYSSSDGKPRKRCAHQQSFIPGIEALFSVILFSRTTTVYTAVTQIPLWRKEKRIKVLITVAHCTLIRSYWSLGQAAQCHKVSFQFSRKQEQH